jgi:hypothetical protein
MFFDHLNIPRYVDFVYNLDLTSGQFYKHSDQETTRHPSIHKS